MFVCIIYIQCVEMFIKKSFPQEKARACFVEINVFPFISLVKWVGQQDMFLKSVSDLQFIFILQESCKYYL